MKFSNGCWLQKEGTEVFSPAEVYFSKVNQKEVVICAPTHKINHRGDTLGGVNLTIRITSPAPEVLRIQTNHYLGVRKKTPEFELDTNTEHALMVKEQEDTIEVKSGSLRVVIQKDNWKMTFYRGEEKVTDSGAKDLAYVKTDWRGLAYDNGGEEDTYMRERLSLSVGELIYGMGERFTPFIKNGQTIDIWNEDGGTSTEQSYKNIPFYISNKGYGVFVNHPEKVSFEVGSENVKKVQFSVPGEGLDYFLINGPSMKEALMRYTDLTGKPSLPPAWTFGLWLSTSFTTNYDEETVNRFVDGMLERGIPLKVFHFDCFWMKEFHWSDFTWDSRVFPDPAGMLRRLKQKGLKICVWINSYIGQESSLFAEGVENGYFVKRKNGDVWQWDMWQPGMALVDFTNPKARDWFASKLEVLLDMGVDCFKTDFGERIPTDVVYYDGSDPMKMHNYYTYLYNKTVFDLLERKRGKGEAVLFARSATVGGQKFPVHWGGDCWSDYESMAESLRGGLSLTMSGFGYWSHDIGGFENTSTPDVYKRWCAFGLLSTHSRLHGSSSYRVPWAYDEEAVDVVRFFTRLKASLMPYLFRNAIETSKIGIPSMRSMVMEFTEDPVCAYLDRQYMLGDSLLVAPIFNEEGIAEYYLPEGKWTNYFTGEVKTGSRYIKEKHGYLSIPLLVREGSLVAIGAKDDDPVYDYADGVTLKAYELIENQPASTVVYDANANLTVKAEVLKKDNQIRINVETAKPYTVVLVNTTNLASIENGSFEVKGRDTIITPNGSGEVVCTLK
ncbi:MAG TPA: alpha-xylosidase [Lachnospiraceae bacterium]|jgi:alpha-D-xyloside xylohydrolase|nr:alpha-xylosidase [Lachnospiraceae bacterium]HCA70345.1 alpha-xylosidase [Lachnospiraceae bacterium]HCM12199.1 alpha-xylosidase [Lachnospiraceae bacterium]